MNLYSKPCNNMQINSEINVHVNVFKVTSPHPSVAVFKYFEA